MVAVAIVGILAAIAYPSYQDHVRRSRRPNATRALMEASAAMEQFFAQRQTYVGAVLATVYASVSPGGFYTLSFGVAPTATSYTLQVAPVAGKGQDADKCGSFTLSSAGVRGVSGGTLTAAECWK